MALLFALVVGCHARQGAKKPRREGRGDLQPGGHPKADVATALVKAKQENKRVLVMFGGDWCVWCQRFHAVLLKDAAIPPLCNPRYVLVMADAAKGEPYQNYDKDGKKHGYPFLTILAADGRVLVNQETGVLEQGKGYDIEKVKAFLTKWAP